MKITGKFLKFILILLSATVLLTVFVKSRNKAQ